MSPRRGRGHHVRETRRDWLGSHFTSDRDQLLNPPEPTPTGQPSDLTGPYGVDQQGSCLGTAGKNPHRPSRPPESLDRSLARGHRPTGYPSFLDDSHRPRALLRTAPHGSKADALIPWMKKAWVQIADRASPQAPGGLSALVQGDGTPRTHHISAWVMAGHQDNRLPIYMFRYVFRPKSQNSAKP